MNSSRLTSNCMSSTSLKYTKSSLFRDYRAWWFLRYKADILLRFFDIFLWRDQCKACLLFISFQSFQIIPNILHFLLIFTSTNMGLRYQYPGSKVYLSCLAHVLSFSILMTSFKEIGKLIPVNPKVKCFFKKSYSLIETWFV